MSNKTKTKENTFFKDYDLYSDANPKDTIRIKYKNLSDVKNTIKKLEKLYKSNKIKHNRNSQIVNVMTQRLRVILKNNNKGKDRYDLSNKYFNFIKERTKLSEDKRKKLIFKF
jgi:predicted S18 family serine protease